MFDIKFEMNIQWMEKKCFMICTLQNTINSYFRVYKKIFFLQDLIWSNRVLTLY